MSAQVLSNMDPPEPIRTQADRLPEFTSLTIPCIKKLSDAGDLYFWGNCIHISLGCRQLTDLISTTIPRPKRLHPRYRNWALWSRLVSKWLVRNVDEKFTPHFKNVQSKLEFADTTYKEIRELNIPKTAKEDRMHKALIDLWNTRRHHYLGIDQYVDAWRDQVLATYHHTRGFSYLSATLIMLHEIEAEMPVLVKFIMDQVEGRDHTAPDQMTYNEFNEIVRGIIGAVQKENRRLL